MNIDIQNMSFSIIGGDRRQCELIKLIFEEGGKLKVYGFSPDNILEKYEDSNRIHIFENLTEDLLNSNLILLPIPYKNKDGFINAKYTDQLIKWEDVIEKCQTGSTIILGKQDTHILKAAKQKDIHIVDVIDDERFSILNAIPSAEGAIQMAMVHSPITIHGSNCLVLGYGRIGKVLARMLKGIGAKVTVEARKNTDLTWIKENGYIPIHLNDINRIIYEQDFIFNTIPYPVLNKEILSSVNKKSLIIDLASYPGGTDFQTAKELGINARLDLGLPGLVAPKTAAQIILDISMDIYNNK